MSVPKPREASADNTAKPGPEGPLHYRLGHFFETVLGVLLFCAAVGILTWNERRVVEALRGSGQAAREVAEVAAAVVDPAYDGRLIRTTGALRTVAPLTDPAMGISEPGLVHLKRTVEMYQWKQIRHAGAGAPVDLKEPTRAAYSYAKRWSETSIDSRAFALRHENPPMPVRSELATAQDATIGGRSIAPSLLMSLDAFQPIAPPPQGPPGYARTSDGFYKGADPDAPEIGDIRVRFAGVPAQPVSVIAEQRGSMLAPFQTTRGAAVGVIAPGDQSAAALVAKRKPAEKILTWTMRGVGFVLFAVALGLFALPLARAQGTPITNGRTPVVALGMAVPLTLATIAAAWIVTRPLLGITLLVTAALFAVSFRYLRRSSRLATAPASSAKPPVAPPAYASSASSCGR